MFNKITFILSFFLLAISVNAAEQGKITGQVVTANDNSPLISATVALHKVKDSTITIGAITGKSGDFTISADIGEYFIEVKFMGYKTQIFYITLTPSKLNIDLDKIKLELTEIMQKEVIVEAEKEPVILGIDSKTFNVTKDLTAGGSNVLDVLRKIPSVNVDNEDNITMNGSSPKILIDGRESNFTSKEMLKVLSSDLVESVELITNPSAKYESEGVSGIIDIKLKKEIDDGFNGMFNLWGGGDFKLEFVKRGGGSFTGNYKLGKINLFGNIAYSNWSGYGYNNSHRTTWIGGDTAYTNNSNDYDYDGQWIGGKIGADIEFTKQDVMSVSVNIGGYASDNASTNDYDLMDEQYVLKELYNYHSHSESTNQDANFAINYKKTFGEKGHNLYIDAYISRDAGTGNGVQSKNYEIVIAGDNVHSDLYNSDNSDKTIREVVQIDYEKTLQMLGNFGAGAKMVYRQINDNNNEYQFNPISNIFELTHSLTDSYNYDDGILAAYITLGKKWTSFAYRLGLRTEYTDWKFHSNVLDKTFTDNYLSIVPTASLKYNFGVTHSFSVSYARRLQRPWYSQLNPFESVIDSSSINTGNPELKPSYYNSYSFDYMLFTPKTTITTSLFFRNTDNSSQYYNTVTEWGGIRSYPMNIAKNSSYGASISLMQTITDWWNLNAFFSIRKQTYDAPEYGINNRFQTNWSANLNTTFRIIEKLRLQVSGYYSPANISLQGESGASYAMNAGLNYDFWNDKMSVNLNFNNIIFQGSYKYSSFGEYFNASAESNWQHRTFSLNLSYKINNYQQKQERNIDDGSGGGGGEGGGGGGQSGI